MSINFVVTLKFHQVVIFVVKILWIWNRLQKEFFVKRQAPRKLTPHEFFLPYGSPYHT